MTAVSSRLRYEVFRRDGFTCRYCGRKAPDVKLQVDAVTPEALGGSHRDPSNLATACADCNSGKSATPPDAPLVADVQADALRWARARKLAVAEQMAAASDLDEYGRAFDNWWCTYDLGSGSPVPREAGWEGAVIRWFGAGIPLPVLIESTRVAMTAGNIPVGRRWRYLCGIVRNRVCDLDARTAEILGGQ